MVELSLIKSSFLGILIISVVGITLILILVAISGNSILNRTDTYNQQNLILADNNSAQTLSQTPTNTPAVTAWNDTWLEFDGSDDFMYIANNSYSTVSLWYKNDTTDWQNIINSSGDLFMNGSSIVVGDLPLYPLYYNGSDFIFGKSDISTFLNVDIDEIRFYNGSINSTIVGEIYNANR